MKLRMSRLLAITVCAFCLLAGGQSLAQNAYITNSSSNNVSVIAAATNTVTATIAVGTNPIGVAVSPDGVAGSPNLCSMESTLIPCGAAKDAEKLGPSYRLVG